MSEDALKIDPFEESADVAEEDVCGSLLRGPEHIDHAATLLNAEDFLHEKHQIVFRVAQQMRNENHRVDAKSLAVRLLADGFATVLNGEEAIYDMLSRMKSSVEDVGNLAQMAKLVKQRRMFRQMAQLGSQMVMRATKHDTDASEMASWFSEKIIKISQSELNRDSIPLSSIAREAFERYDAYDRGEKAKGITSGLDRLDLLTGGFMPREMTIVGARPSVGKSALMAQCALAAGWTKIPTVIYSLEMDRASLFDRMMSAIGTVTLHRLRGIAPLDARDAEKIAEQDHPERLAGYPIYVFDRRDITASMMANSIRHHVTTKGVKIAFIDYLQYITPENERDSPNVQIGKSCRILKNIAEECNIPVVCLAQLNRENQNRADTTPRLSDLKGSGDIEQTADVILLLDRLDDDDKLEHHRVNLIVAKNRNGPRGLVETEYDRKYVRFIEKVPT